MKVLIYFIGVVVAYMLTRKFIRNLLHENRDNYNWDDILGVFIVSLLSWITVIIAIIAIVCKKLREIEPPKWL